MKTNYYLKGKPKTITVMAIQRPTIEEWMKEFNSHYIQCQMYALNAFNAGKCFLESLNECYESFHFMDKDLVFNAVNEAEKKFKKARFN